MRVLLINSVCGIRSTGRICTDTAEALKKQGHEVKIAYGRETVPEQYQTYAVRIGSEWSVRKNALSCRLFDNDGLTAKRTTKKFLAWAEAYDPDMLWLHNLHGYYINIEMLFQWIKSRPNMQVKWTLHDCWAFTGHCSHFTLAKCEKWKSRCRDCPQKFRYPKSIWKDNSLANFDRKKQAFTGVKDMTLITPSNWLAKLVKESFLQDYPVETQYNTVDTNIFKPTPSDFRERYGLENKIIILGVASAWSKGKGLEDFEKLAGMLDDRYAVVLVGLTDRQMKRLSGEIIGIQRTNDTAELAKIYSAADLYINLSREETFGMTTAEAIACGTETVVYKGTACEEIADRLGGQAVNDNLEAMYGAITKITLSGAQINAGGVALIIIKRTDNIKGLAALYSAADVLVNPTYEDTYPTVNLESEACGTPVITYDIGGCAETLHHPRSMLVRAGNVDELYECIVRLTEISSR